MEAIPRLFKKTNIFYSCSVQERPGPKSRKQSAPKRHTQKLTPALTEINSLQQSTKVLIPLAPFHRVIRSIFQELNSDFRITKTCLEALQEATELYLVSLTVYLLNFIL